MRHIARRVYGRPTDGGQYMYYPMWSVQPSVGRCYIWRYYHNNNKVLWFATEEAAILYIESKWR